MFNYLDWLKSYNIDIHYDSHENSYMIEKGVVIETQEPIRILKNNELITTNGGEKIFERVQGNWTDPVLTSAFQTNRYLL